MHVYVVLILYSGMVDIDAVNCVQSNLLFRVWHCTRASVVTCQRGSRS